MKYKLDECLLFIRRESEDCSLDNGPVVVIECLKKIFDK